MTESQKPTGSDSKIWLIWLGLGVVIALVGPTWLYNWQFNPATQDAQPTPAPQQQGEEVVAPEPSPA